MSPRVQKEDRAAVLEKAKEAKAQLKAASKQSSTQIEVPDVQRVDIRVGKIISVEMHP